MAGCANTPGATAQCGALLLPLLAPRWLDLTGQDSGANHGIEQYGVGLQAAIRTGEEAGGWAGSATPSLFSSPTTLREKVAELDGIPLALSYRGRHQSGLGPAVHKMLLTKLRKL